MSRSAMLTRRRSPSSRIRRFGLRHRISTASSLNRGAIRTSRNWPDSASASSASTGRLRQITPPNADTGSHANARRYASSAEPPTAQPHGLLCLMIAQAGSSNSPTSSRPALRSSTLLNDSSLPPSCRTIESTSMRAPTCR